jgi:FkbM family methyltransferase
MQSLLDRRLPLRTRVDLLAADLRRTLAKRELYGVRYGRAAAHGALAIVAYEPESANLAVLEQAARAYRTGELAWDVHGAAVDAASWHAELQLMQDSWAHALHPPASFAEWEIGLERVGVVALARVLEEAASHAGSRLVVKVNIEGAECSAILGTPPAAWANVDEVFVETHPWAECDLPQLASHLALSGLTRVESAHPAVLRMRREAAPRGDRRSVPT